MSRKRVLSLEDAPICDSSQVVPYLSHQHTPVNSTWCGELLKLSEDERRVWATRMNVAQANVRIDDLLRASDELVAQCALRVSFTAAAPV